MKKTELGGEGDVLRVSTPSTSHLSDEKFKNVYEPSEDSFLLMDALQQDAHTLKLLHPKTVLEMGCGSGCVTSFLASLLHQLAKKEQNRENHFPIFFAVDKQQEALDATRLTLKHNNPGVSLELLRCDLFQAFKKPFLESKLSTGPCAVKEEGKRDVTCSKGSPINEGPFDLILFNPPYVPGSPRGVVASEDLPWWGGVLGREVIDCFVDKVMEFLSPRGILYLVTKTTYTIEKFENISLKLLERRNKPEEVVSMLEAKGCTGQLLASRKIRGEVLSIWRFSRVDYSLLADGFQASCLKPSK